MLNPAECLESLAKVCHKLELGINFENILMFVGGIEHNVEIEDEIVLKIFHSSIHLSIKTVFVAIPILIPSSLSLFV